MTAAVSQQLWTCGGALVQRAQGPNIPFGESLTSKSTLSVGGNLSSSMQAGSKSWLADLCTDNLENARIAKDATPLPTTCLFRF